MHSTGISALTAGLLLIMVDFRPSDGKVEITSKQFNDVEDKYPTKCHVCRFLVEEIYIYMKNSSTHDVVETGSEFQNNRKKIKFNKSELRLIEAIEEACQKMLEYNVHKDKPIRYQRGRSTTFQTLHGLKNRGVKVDLGFPYEMWDQPDREIQDMKKKCEQLVEDYESDISSWYYDHQEQNLTHWLCKDRVLRQNEQDCLDIESEDVFPDIKQLKEDAKKKKASAKKKNREIKDGNKEDIIRRHATEVNTSPFENVDGSEKVTISKHDTTETPQRFEL